MKKNKEQQFFDRMAALIGRGEALRLMEILSQPAPKSVRYNRGLCTTDELKGDPVPWDAPFGRYWQQQALPSHTLEYAAGKYYIQEAAAMLPIAAAETVVDFAGKIVLDLAAAPGGKTTQAAEAIGSGYIVANEVVKKRTAALTWNINRHRLNNVVVTSLPTALLARSLPGFFDIVIVDAPCSGEGLFQRGKHSLSSWSEKNVLSCARRQQRILRDALELLRPGGYLIYSTCTFAVEENEQQVEFLLERGLRPVPLPASLPVSPAVTGNKKAAACARRVFPHRERGAGAFVAVLQKKPGKPDLPGEKPLDYVFHNTQEIISKGGFPFVGGSSAANRDFSGVQGSRRVGPPLSGFAKPEREDLAEVETLPKPSTVLGKAKGKPTTACKASGAEGYFFEKSGVVSYFSYDRAPDFLYRNSLQVGAPLFDRRRGDELMFGAVQAAPQEAVVEVSEQEAESYIRGEEIKLDLPAGDYFVSFQGMVLGPVSVSRKGAVNKFPKSLQVV